MCIGYARRPRDHHHEEYTVGPAGCVTRMWRAKCSWNINIHMGFCSYSLSLSSRLTLLAGQGVSNERTVSAAAASRISIAQLNRIDKVKSHDDPIARMYMALKFYIEKKSFLYICIDRSSEPALLRHFSGRTHRRTCPAR